MPAAPNHPLEPRRLETLRLYGVLDTAPERELDDLTRLAAEICDTPISLISLVDQSRQWFKSRVGLAVSATPRDQAFCAHAILTPEELLVVPDALADSRFSDNPLVTSDPKIRFYAGAPLVVAGGLALGTLCVIDTRPRELSPHQQRALRTLRGAAVAQLELKRRMAELAAAEGMLSMCSSCRRVQDGSGRWDSLDAYLHRHGTVTHGICPSCADQLFPGLGGRRAG